MVTRWQQRVEERILLPQGVTECRNWIKTKQNKTQNQLQAAACCLQFQLQGDETATSQWPPLESVPVA